MNITYVYYSKNRGSYNWADLSEKSWQIHLQVRFDDNSRIDISETWDDEPDTDGLLPTDILDMIEERLNYYWINTSRDRTQKDIAALREHGNDLNIPWLQARIARKKKELEELEATLEEQIHEPV